MSSFKLKSDEKYNIQTKRILWIDLVKTIAIIFVLVVHSTEMVYPFTLEGVGREPLVVRVVLFAFFTAGRLGVPLFLFSTGYLLLDREWDYMTAINFWKKNFVGLLLTTEVWIILYNLYLSFYNGSQISFIEIIKNMLFMTNPPLGHWWYMPCILGIYLFIPILGVTLRKLELKLLIIPGGGIILQMLPGNIGENLNLNFMGGYYGLIVVTGYLCKKGILKSVKSTFLIICTVVCFLLTVIFQIILYKIGYIYNVWYNFLPLIVAALCLFELLSRIRICSNKRSITYLSKNSFGIYLLHYPICMLCVNIIGLDNGIVKVVVLFLVCFFSSVAIVEFVKRIPKINKLILYNV